MQRIKSLSLVTLACLAMGVGSAYSALISHYTFDAASGGTTADSIGSNSASLGNRVQINTTVTGRIGSGALEMLGGGFTQGPGDGATTRNSFSWYVDGSSTNLNPSTNALDIATGAGPITFGDSLVSTVTSPTATI
jgi:hypothetical protein